MEQLLPRGDGCRRDDRPDATGVFLVCVVLAPTHGLVATSVGAPAGRITPTTFTNEEVEVS
ncbi:MAG: hypothetical protein IPH65_15005 [Dehalococcoidia bacterium]|uniref:hypothetical protein n=1 Tax=Candidatus Amarobacter glycogenicus TaxID=3140699 RepID=UPI0031347716|nr:hypothetical protein [Dehalococcoidia bacterium]